MPQILAVTTQGHYTESQRDVLRADIMRQLDGCDALVLILPPGVQLQNTFLPAVAVVVPRKVDDVVSFTSAVQYETNGIVRHAPVETSEAEDGAWPPAADDRRTGGFVGDPAGLGGREVQHVDADEPEEAPTPYVWLYRNMLTDLQALAPLGRDETNGQYAVAIDQLTDAQRAIPHVKKQLEAMYLNDEIDGAVYFDKGA